MILPSLAGPVRSSLRLVVATFLPLLVLSPVEICFAAEVTLADKYSVQLPEAWEVTLKEKKYLAGDGPGGVVFSVGVRASDQSPEGLMEKDLGEILEKKPGYKLIQKGPVQTSAGGKAQFIRYQESRPNGSAANVEYFLQLAEKEIVLLRFTLPDFSSTSAKSEIEAIFNSIKFVTAAGPEDSWLTPPSDKSKESSKATGAGDSEIAGKYVSTQQSSDYIILKADGTFSYQIGGESGTSTYTRNGATITLKFGDDPDDAKLEKDALVDASGKRWVRSTAPAAPAAPKTAGTQVAFATNCSVELPAGWTGKASDKYLQGKGPDKSTIDGFSVESAMSVEEALDQHLSIFGKMPGYELLTTNDFVTNAGAKGKMAYYHYKPASGATAEVGVVIKVAPNQLVTLRFLAPNTTKKLSKAFIDGTATISASLKISK